MRSSYKHLGEYIEIVTRVNSDLKYGIEDVRGCSNTKKMMQTRANLIGRTYEKFIVLIGVLRVMVKELVWLIMIQIENIFLLMIMWHLG